MKKLLCATLLFITSVFFLIGCGETSIKVPKPDFETQKISEDIFECEIPSTWIKADISAVNGQFVYVPSDADLSKGTSNVNVIATKTDKKAPSMKDAKSELQAQIEATFSEYVSNINFDETKVNAGDVCIMTYTINIEGITMNQVMYYILIDDYQILITSTNTNDNISPSSEAVAKHIINTIKLRE